jgi:transketolase
MAEMVAMRDAFGKAIVELGELNPRVVVLDCDVGSSTKALMFKDAHPDRFFQMGIAEQNMMGVSAGLASMGFIPFATTFAWLVAKRASDQVRLVVAQPKLNVKIAGHYSGLLIGKLGKTHQSVQDIAIMRSMPNMTVLVPGDAVEVVRAVHAAAEYDGPVYIRVTRDPSPVIFGDDHDLKIGRALTLREGRDVTVMTTGLMCTRALEAAETLAAEGISAQVLHIATVKPIDVDAVVAAATRTGLVVTAEDHNVIGGLGSAVAEVLGEHAPTRMKRVGVADTYSESAPNELILEKYGLASRHIVRACMDLVESRTRSKV